MKEISERIKELRISKGLSQEDLGRELKLSKQTISNYENGDRIPSLETIIRLSDIFNVDTDYLLCKSKVKNKVVSNIIQELIDIQSSVLDNSIIIKLEGIFQELYNLLKLFLCKNNPSTLLDLMNMLLKEITTYITAKDTDSTKHMFNLVHRLNDIQNIIIKLYTAYKFDLSNFSKTNTLSNMEYSVLPYPWEKE